MTSAVDGLKQRFMDMSQPDADGVYRNGAVKRKARTDLAMDCLKQLWQEACQTVSFDVPQSPTSSSMSLPTNCGIRFGIRVLILTSRCVPARSARR